MNTSNTSNSSYSSSNFIQNIIREDLKLNKNNGRVHTRFPPEPNGYLHIGHAKSICLNFGTALEFNGCCNLRFDDTNPSKEETEFVESIQEDVQWLGFSWQDRMYYASDYFEKLYAFAIKLIEKDKAFVCDLSAEEIREYRGTLTQPGEDSPYRTRSVEENLDLFQRMRAGEFPNGAKVLRAKIDMGSPNLNMRDPVIYRIMHASHHRTGNAWCIYPMYDFAHPLSDALEHITHSICTMEFEDHRPLYDWLTEQLIEGDRPRQYEFARLDLTNTVMSKRKLRQLVEGGYVQGWDDPRMPTISGLRRRGYTPEAIRDFCDRIGVAKANSIVDVALLEHCLREDLNSKAKRVMAVLDPIKVILINYPENQEEFLEAENNPEDPEAGTRLIPFSRTIYIEREDFMEEPPKKFFRLSPGNEVRLKHAYIIKCERVLKDEDGQISEIHCTYDPDTKSGGSASSRKVKGTLHWVSAAHAENAEIRLYDYLIRDDQYTEDDSAESDDFLARINPDSLRILKQCKIEPGLKEADPGSKYQFLRQGYFCADLKDHSNDHPVFNQIVGLRDSWAKINK
ncbi:MULTISPECIES: glutamine--tRNA ligase/YqeY domain fusion protein [unclassified Dehalobacter]|uniref:glutamine--tRNA ligase/YqeY domain fusion protein n=1 Tax=unclassified Dehalobacter TaxID=2635733 RepID=UPI000E6BDDDE|nr:MULTISPECIES: glutamine--tRNA ligase/YqeY domain fusion protein [unclassified Dehalobacter]RJE48449.1 glutamine--tRNA ligase [Dehalobacter sp. MCB1]TCX50518.1 glutamine--tRNA ligase/YqeY domain fusion protein [Dehalobacter sp. 14DCB1]TCX52242.1 glutamine--tRNA ligase/YqeY domain fusion protein [Dehalobacter sp. 12DCB1]